MIEILENLVTANSYTKPCQLN